jgi:hypothetical protein
MGFFLFVVALPKEAKESKATVTAACGFAKTLQQCEHCLISVGLGHRVFKADSDTQHDTFSASIMHNAEHCYVERLLCSMSLYAESH